MAALQDATLDGFRLLFAAHIFRDIANAGGRTLSTGVGCKGARFAGILCVSPAICSVENSDPVLTKRFFSAIGALDGSGRGWI